MALTWPRLYFMSSKCLSATVWCSSSWPTTCGYVLPSFSGRERAISFSAGSALSWWMSMNTAISKQQRGRHNSNFVIFFSFLRVLKKLYYRDMDPYILYKRFFLVKKRKHHMPNCICWRRATRYPTCYNEAVSEGSTICWTLCPLPLQKARNCSLLM